MSEFGSAMWMDILGTPKSGRARFVVMSDQLDRVLRDLLEPRQQATLRGQWKEPPPFVFCSETGGLLDERNVSRSWNRLRRKAQKEGVRPLRLHDARHTFASLALASHKSIPWVAGQLGHASPEITLRAYAHALKEEETDLLFLDFGDTKRHPRGTPAVGASQRTKPPRLTTRRGFESLEHETRFELATPVWPNGQSFVLAARQSLSAPPSVGNVLQSLNSLMFTRFTVRRGA